MQFSDHKRPGARPLSRLPLFAVGKTLAFSAALLAATAAPASPAEPSAVTSISSAVRKIFEECRQAVVRVEARDSRGVLRGTGFYVDPVGTLYTLASVAEGAGQIEVLRDGKRYPAEVLASDPRSGIAILRTEPPEMFLKPAKNPQLSIASPVVLIGYPLDLDASPGFGLISGFDKKIGKVYFSTTHMRVNLPVLRGQGGAPLLDMDGAVVGIVTSSVDGGATCYALPIAAAEKLRRDLARFGEIRHGWVGVVVDSEPSPGGGQSVVVCEIDPSAPAARAGIRTGDIILRVGQTPVRTKEDVLDASFFLSAGEPAEIEIVRDGERLVIEAETALHPNARKPALHAGLDIAPLSPQ